MSGGADVAYWAIIAAFQSWRRRCAPASLIVLLPWLKSYALAQPVDRSSHREPTPQGGGLGVILSTLIVAWLAAASSGALPQGALAPLSALTGGRRAAHIGRLARRHARPVAGPSPARAVPGGRPDRDDAASRRAPLLGASAVGRTRRASLWLGVWFVNLVNFMDGIDWMTVAEAVPITAAIVVLGLAGVVPPLATLVALALLGAILGFAPFNRPVARLFLGDVGSLPVGLVLGWLLLLLAVSGHLAAALLLPLYYLADATITLAAAHRPARAVLASPSQPLLSARRRRRADGARRRRARVRNQCRRWRRWRWCRSPPAARRCRCYAWSAGAALVGFLLAHFAKARL